MCDSNFGVVIHEADNLNTSKSKARKTRSQPIAEVNYEQELRRRSHWKHPLLK